MNANKNTNSTEKRKKKDKTISIEELYRNKNFVPPKEKNLETIFEEPRKSKDGAPMLTSVKKFKRYLHFDTTVGKIHKRKVKAKKCIKKMKMGNSKTRSATKVDECPDISLYISEVLGESSESEMEVLSEEISLTDDNQSKSTIDPLRSTKSDESCDGVNKNMPKDPTSDEEGSNLRNSSCMPSSFEKTSQSTEHISLDVPDSSNTETGDTNDTSRSSCVIT